MQVEARKLNNDEAVLSPTPWYIAVNVERCEVRRVKQFLLFPDET